MAIKALKYVLAFFMLCISFQWFSLALDHLFFEIEGFENEAAIQRGNSIYFPFFIGYYGWVLIIVLSFFEIAVFVISYLQSSKVQFLLAAVAGGLIGLAIGDDNISMYKGRFEDLKSVIVYGLLGVMFVTLKLLFKIGTRLWRPEELVEEDE